jgi:aminoglycoside phosphotransferase
VTFFGRAPTPALGLRSTDFIPGFGRSNPACNSPLATPFQRAPGALVMGTDAPNSAIAGNLAASAVGRRPTEVRRFRTGSHHYVFEAIFEDRPAVVVRIAAEHGRSAMAGALRLSRLLRPQGVPLPEIIAEGLNHQFPQLVLERLPGTDLGDVIRGLSNSSLEAIATKVARAQRVAARTASSGRYGYAVMSMDAPHDNWSQVLQDNLTRSRRRIAAAGLFDLDAVDAVAAMISAARAELDSLPPVPFLHDTTTKNVIVTTGGTFSGIVDVDDLCFGDPRYVVALALASLTASGGPVQYIDAWMNSPNYRSDRIFRLYVALFIVDFMSEHGQVFNGNLLPSSADDRNQLLRVFAERLRLAAR